MALRVKLNMGLIDWNMIDWLIDRNGKGADRGLC